MQVWTGQSDALKNVVSHLKCLTDTPEPVSHGRGVTFQQPHSWLVSVVSMLSHKLRRIAGYWQCLAPSWRCTYCRRNGIWIDLISPFFYGWRQTHTVNFSFTVSAQVTANTNTWLIRSTSAIVRKTGLPEICICFFLYFKWQTQQQSIKLPNITQSLHNPALTELCSSNKIQCLEKYFSDLMVKKDYHLLYKCFGIILKAAAFISSSNAVEKQCFAAKKRNLYRGTINLKYHHFQRERKTNFF